MILLVAEPGGGGMDAGLFAVCLNLPHLLGPLLARRLDRVGDGRPFIATCCVLYGVALAAAALSIGRAPLVVSLAFVVVAGVCGPVLTAGLSSQLSLMVPPSKAIQRRAQGLDALTYGVAGSAGPAIVASIATASTPLTAVLALSGTAAVAGALMMTLPAVPTQDGPEAETALGMRRVISHIVHASGLRRATVAMMVTSFVAGSMAILAVGRGIQLRGDPDSGALLAALYGAGSLLGSIFTSVVPLKGEADRTTICYSISIGTTFVLGGLAPNFATALVAFVIAGFLSGPFFVATLAARTAYSPDRGRAQVFVAMGALKITLSAAGAAVAGLIGFDTAGIFLALGGAFIVAVGAALILDRHRRPPTSGEGVSLGHYRR
ncbi:MFS transporter [Amycolatopsis carbonis]|uniref:MFS transporter n=1 Tax=Amycolatopsis carbonis TaxID=715471 RepID=A0A9Y2ILN1_9PSEU|nr:MFS transporter [Amycolatopsis sp. 2-15]WIX80883.1 MFS transporter [Amycolatopsis sp. 2-15]